MAKLTKEEIQALIRVMGATTYHMIKSRDITSECGGEVRNWRFESHTVEIWYGRHVYKPTGKIYMTTRVSARSKYEDRAWRNAYMKFIKMVKNDG